MCIAGRRNTFKGSHWANKSNLLEKWKPQKVKEENCCYATNWKVVGSTRGLAHVNGKFDSKNFHGISFEVPYAAHRRTTSSVGQSNSLTSADQKQLLKLECVGLGARSTFTHIHIDAWSYIYVQYINFNTYKYSFAYTYVCMFLHIYCSNDNLLGAAIWRQW